MTSSRHPSQRPDRLALASLLALVSRITLEGLDGNLRPRHVNRDGSALVDAQDLAQLGRAHREYVSALPTVVEEEDESS